MKAIYYTVTFLAALVVLGWAGWETYLHWDVLKKIDSVPKLLDKHKVSHDCNCKDCKCDPCECKTKK